jgi:hypothetical protein
MPEPILRASTVNFPIGHLIHARGYYQEKDYWKGDTETVWLMGHRMPPFQRPAVWTAEQKVRFMESAWMGLHLGTYVVNRNDSWDEKLGRPHRADLWLIDGQQRLRALEEYLDGAFPVFGYRWSQLPRHEQRRLDNTTFSQSTVHEGDEALLRELYDRLNFGGTPHTEDQRAS